MHIVDHMRNPDGFVRSLNRKAFEDFLRMSAEKRGVRCIWNAKLQHSSFESVWKVQINSNEEKSEPVHILASYVIDASGRQSHFAKSRGVKRHVEDKLMACWISLPNTKENTMSTISASENGWWYSAIVPNNRRVIAFHTDSDLIDKNRLKTIESFLLLAKENKEISDLITDAALSFDPLSSQGMFNAMASAMHLSLLIRQLKFTDKLAKKYAHQTHQIWSRYLEHKQIFYQAEARWKSSEFWRRRHHRLT